MDKLDKIFAENPELQEQGSELVYHIMPTIIESLLLSGVIDRTRIEDPQYIWSVVIENLDVVDALTHSKRIDDQLLETASEAAKTNKIPIAIILTATAIEHIVNIFYRDILERLFDFSREVKSKSWRYLAVNPMVPCYLL